MQSENEKKKRRDEQVGKDSGFYIGKERCVDDQKNRPQLLHRARQKRKTLGNRPSKAALRVQTPPLIPGLPTSRLSPKYRSSRRSFP